MKREAGFDSNPQLEMLPSGVHWELLRPLIYTGEEGTAHIIPKGFVTDLSSIPWFLQSIVQVNGTHSRAAILHDYFYAMRHVTRREADRYFKQAMEALNVRWTRSTIMWLAVRLFGWWSWYKDGKALVE